MNKFEASFFSKYLPEGQELKGIIHIHFIEIFAKLFLWLMMGAILPSFLYFYSDRIKELIPFYFLEGLLIFVFIKVIYDIFDWYNDVWIITNEGIHQLNRSLFKNDTISVEYEKIEGLEVIQDGLSDKILRKGNIIIHKIGDDTLELQNSINPFKSVDLIEEISNENNENEGLDDDKFDIIMDALGGVVENYLDKKMTKSEKEDEIHKKIESIEKAKGTIDLR